MAHPQSSFVVFRGDPENIKVPILVDISKRHLLKRDEIRKPAESFVGELPAAPTDQEMDAFLAQDDDVGDFIAIRIQQINFVRGELREEFEGPFHETTAPIIFQKIRELAGMGTVFFLDIGSDDQEIVIPVQIKIRPIGEGAFPLDFRQGNVACIGKFSQAVVD